MSSNTPPTRLRELRELHNPRLSQEQLAREMGWPVKRIQRYEKGTIPLEAVKRLALRFGVTLGYMLREDEEAAA